MLIYKICKKISLREMENCVIWMVYIHVFMLRKDDDGQAQSTFIIFKEVG